MMTTRFRLGGLLAACLTIFFVSEAHGQTTGGVFPPNVNEGHRSIQYRAAYLPDNKGLGRRLHYQQAVNGDIMLRALVQTRKTADSDFDLDFLQAEMFWELSKDDATWRTGFRVDARFRFEGRPAQFGLNWMNRWKVADNVDGRFLVLSSINVGEGAAKGVGLQSRGALNYTGFDGFGVGLELFSAYGSTENFAAFEDQRHAIGPTINVRVAQGVSLFGGPLFGLTEATPNIDWRFWLTKVL